MISANKSNSKIRFIGLLALSCHQKHVTQLALLLNFSGVVRGWIRGPRCLLEGRTEGQCQPDGLGRNRRRLGGKSKFILKPPNMCLDKLNMSWIMIICKLNLQTYLGNCSRPHWWRRPAWSKGASVQSWKRFFLRQKSIFLMFFFSLNSSLSNLLELFQLFISDVVSQLNVRMNQHAWRNYDDRGEH